MINISKKSHSNRAYGVLGNIFFNYILFSFFAVTNKNEPKHIQLIADFSRTISIKVLLKYM